MVTNTLFNDFKGFAVPRHFLFPFPLSLFPPKQIPIYRQDGIVTEKEGIPVEKPVSTHVNDRQALTDYINTLF